MAKTETVKVPLMDLDVLFDQFMREARMDAMDVVALPPEYITPVRKLMVSLNIALNSINTPEKLEEFRAQMSAMLGNICEADDKPVREGHVYTFAPEENARGRAVSHFDGRRVRVVSAAAVASEDDEPQYRVKVMGMSGGGTFVAFESELHKERR